MKMQTFLTSSCNAMDDLIQDTHTEWLKKHRISYPRGGGAKLEQQTSYWATDIIWALISMW